MIAPSSADVVDAARAGGGVGILEISLGLTRYREDWEAEKSGDVQTHVRAV